MSLKEHIDRFRSLPRVAPWPRRLAVLAVVVVFGLIFAGAQVTSHDAGLAVPDWPLAYGSVFPDRWTEVRKVFIEHFHRIYAFCVGWLALGVALAFQFLEPRRAVRRLAWSLPLLVLAQALLGAARIFQFNSPLFAPLHGVFGQLTFAAFAALATLTAPVWAAAPAAPAPRTLRSGAAALLALLFGQLVLAAVMRHARAGLAIPDLPMLRGDWPDFTPDGAVLAFAHRLTGITIAAALLWQWFAVRRGAPALVRRALLLLALAPVQIGLGIATVLSERNPWLASFHTAGGALLLVLQAALLLWLNRAPAAGPPPPAGG